MRRLWLLAPGTAAALAVAAGWNGLPREIEILPPAAGTTVASGLPVLAPCALVSRGDRMPAALALTGWGWGMVRMDIAAVLVRRPGGDLLIDAAYGSRLREDLAGASLLTRLIFGGGAPVPLGRLLERAGSSPGAIRAVALTHTHLDHVGGLVDLPGAEVRLWDREWGFVRARRGYLDAGVMPHQLAVAGGRLSPFAMDGPATDGFDASHDLFGDGSVVAVPLPGHTPGSAGYLLRSGDGRRWLFAGDASWAREGVDRPAHRGRLASLVADEDVEEAGRTLARLNAARRGQPDLVVLPAHDLQDALPACGPPP